MKVNDMKTTAEPIEKTSTVRACLASCRKALARVAAVKQAIFDESRRVMQANERLVRLALNEAEALAWQTAYPHLVFPTLATEKVQAVASWDQHQRRVRADRAGLVF
jgi:hypothetical protein